ncbi:MAG: DUF4169 family protein [Litoreibacter sp.]
MKPINLNQARKAKARTNKRAKASENVVKFGRSKSEKNRIKAEEALQTGRLDHHKLEE